MAPDIDRFGDIVGKSGRAQEGSVQARCNGGIANLDIVGRDQRGIEPVECGDEICCACDQRAPGQRTQVLARHALAAAARRDHGKDRKALPHQAAALLASTDQVIGKLVCLRTRFDGYLRSISSSSAMCPP